MLGLPPDTTSEPSKKFTIPFTVFVGLLLASCYAEPLEMAEKGREAADSLMKGEETDDASTGGVVFDTVWDCTEAEIDLGEGVPME